MSSTFASNTLNTQIKNTTQSTAKPSKTGNGSFSSLIGDLSDVLAPATQGLASHTAIKTGGTTIATALNSAADNLGDFHINPNAIGMKNSSLVSSSQQFAESPLPSPNLPGIGGTGGIFADLERMLEEQSASQARFFAMQQEAQSQQQQHTAMTNLSSTAHNTAMATIRNLKAS